MPTIDRLGTELTKLGLDIPVTTVSGVAKTRAERTVEAPQPTADLSGLRYVAAIVQDDDGDIAVRTTAEGIELDRREMVGYVCAGMGTAKRLKAAIEAGVVFHSPEVRTDINGKTYLSATSRVLGRMLNADLKRLGY